MRTAKAVFLDRDGTINHEVHHLRRVEDLRLLPGTAKAIHDLNRLGYLVIVITNQSAIARGLVDEAGARAIHDELVGRLSKKGASLDGIYYCPHHPKGAVEKYRRVCVCRKPETGMIRKAAKKHNIDLKKSFFIGDTTCDIETGSRAGLTTILVKTGYGGKDGAHKVVSDFTVRNLREAARIIKHS